MSSNKKSKKNKVFWVDDVGSKLEANGILPAHIFEFSETIPGYNPGGVVTTYVERDPGRPPKNLRHIRSVHLQQKDGSVIQVGSRDLKSEFDRLYFF